MLEAIDLINNHNSSPLYIRICDYIKRDIENGVLHKGTKLPSYRKLAEHLGVSRNTIEQAYQQLLSEGYVESKPKSGIYVSDISTGIFLSKNVSISEVIPFKSHSEKNTSNFIDFSVSGIDTSIFPISVWKKLTNDTINNFSECLNTAGDSQGEPGLRNQISRYLYESRGVKCSSEQIVIGASTQYLLYLLYILIDFKDYAVENPGYDRVARILQDLSANVVGIDVDNKGMNVEALSNTEAKVAYITPAHQFPLGYVMPVSRRVEILEWAVNNESYVIEDDYDSEYRFVGKPIPSLHSLDKNDRVIYFGTFTKSLLPSIRLSYMVLPEKLMQVYRDKAEIYSQTVSNIHQKTVELFMERGHWNRHLNKMRTLYKKKHELILTELSSKFGNSINILDAKSGHHLVIEIDGDEDELVASARGVDLIVYPVSQYYFDGRSSEYAQILLGFGSLSFDEIQIGISKLAKVWKK
jgi:GntR family transcriptional regulator/MocR family aminotransferase